MLDRQNLNGQPVSRRDIPAGAIGCLGDAELPTQGNVCFFTGLPINGPDVGDLVDADAAARLFSSYDGAFTGVFWDAQQQVLVIATDCLGMQPLYMQHTDDELTLVSETKTLPGDPDLAAWGAFISIGHPIGERSLVNGLRRVPPASILTYDCARCELSIRRYWQWPEPSDAWRHYDFSASLEQDIRAYAAYGDPGTLLLSGGFDSRLLLFLLQRAGIPADGLIVAHADEYGDADGRLAEAIAKRSGIKYRKAEPASDFFSSSEYRDYLNASDVGYPSMDLFIAKVASQIASNAVWEGLAPGLVFMAPHQPEGGFDAYLPQQVQGLDSAIWHAAGVLFKPEIVEAMFHGFSEDLQHEKSRLPEDEYGVLRFIIESRCRNRPSMNPLKVFSNRADIFTPGLSKGFMTHGVNIPFKEKQHGQFYRRLIAQLDKRALTTPFISGGELIQNTRVSPSYYRERLHNEFYKYRTRYPSLFGRRRGQRPAYSAFLGDYLFEEEDKWLDPDARETLKTVSADSYLAWKLLLHWKAWQWVHDGSLGRKLDAKI